MESDIFHELDSSHTSWGKTFSKSELSHKLAAPAYREFCRKNGLIFHFWDELPEEDFDLEMAKAEFDLQTEALNLFNAVKPEFMYYKGQVIAFKFTSWNGDFDHAAQPLEDFLVQAAQDKRRLDRLERQFEIVCDLLAIALGVLLALAIDRFVGWSLFLPSWTPYVGFIVVGCLGWRWLFNSGPKRHGKRQQAQLETKLNQLRNRLVAAHQALNLRRTDSTLYDRLEDRLGTALSEHIINRLKEEGEDPEMQNSVLHDINDLLLTAGLGGELTPLHLKSAVFLESHLRSSMQVPAQVLMRELPRRTTEWLANEPMKDNPGRATWVEEGRHLLDLARLNSYDSRE